jgi:hypothetical protein
MHKDWGSAAESYYQANLRKTDMPTVTKEKEETKRRAFCRALRELLAFMRSSNYYEALRLLKESGERIAVCRDYYSLVEHTIYFSEKGFERDRHRGRGLERASAKMVLQKFVRDHGDTKGPEKLLPSIKSQLDAIAARAPRL